MPKKASCCMSSNSSSSRSSNSKGKGFVSAERKPKGNLKVVAALKEEVSYRLIQPYTIPEERHECNARPFESAMLLYFQTAT